MSRIVPAAQQLIQQVTSERGKVGAKVVDKPDGFGRHRQIEFDAATSKWLVPILEALEDDRIDHVTYAGKGRATVSFVTDTRADHKMPEFPLVEVRAVLDGTDED